MKEYHVNKYCVVEDSKGVTYHFNDECGVQDLADLLNEAYEAGYEAARQISVRVFDEPFPKGGID